MSVRSDVASKIDNLVGFSASSQSLLSREEEPHRESEQPKANYSANHRSGYHAGIRST
jgi:hypothetical protein